MSHKTHKKKQTLFILNFKKFRWVVVDIKKYVSGAVFYKYRSERKYYGIYLKYTDCIYEICKDKFDSYSTHLKKDPNFIPQMCLFTSSKRR